MKIAVLVSIGRHPVSGAARYSRNDAAALTMALSIAKERRASLDVLHAGDPSNPALQEYLALGASRVEVLDVERRRHRGACRTSARLRPRLTGTRAEGAFDSGMLPYRLADALGIALVGSAVDATGEGGGRRSPAIHAEGTAPARAGRSSPRSSPSIRWRTLRRAMPTRVCAKARSRRSSHAPRPTLKTCNGPSSRRRQNRCASPPPKSARAMRACFRQRRPKAAAAAS